MARNQRREKPCGGKPRVEPSPKAAGMTMAMGSARKSMTSAT